MAYPGGKNGAGVYQQIINRMPPHTVYIEPFLGGGAIMRLKRPAAVNIGLDLSAAAVDAFAPVGSAMRDPLAISGGAHRRASSAAARGSGAAGPARSGDVRPPADPALLEDRSSPRYCFQVLDAMKFLSSYRFTGGELVYCDPPYMHETRGRADLYKFEMTDAQHRQLLALLRTLPCAVMLSGYWTELYGRTLKGWHAFSFQTVNRAGKPTTEWVWCNFAEPVALHDYRYLGQNFRERERIKRKKGRWLARLKGMPMLERRALLAAMGEAWASSPPDAAIRSTASPDPARRAIATTARSGVRRSR